MSELPKGWVHCELKQLISISSGKSLTQKKMVEGTTPVFGGNGITGWHNEGNVFKPTIVIGRVGFYCGSVYITPENAWVTDNAFVTSFSENHIEIEFLYWLLKFTDLRQNDSSSAQPVISGQKVYPIKVKLPPLAEQKRIVEKLDEVLAQVDTIKARLDGIPALLKRFRQSVLASAVSGKLTKEWRGVGSEPFGKQVKLGELLKDGPQNGLYKPSRFYGDGTKIFRIDSFYDGELVDWETIKRVVLEEQEVDKYRVNIDDVLVNRVNSIEYLGKCALVRELPENAVFESNIMRMSINKEKALPAFVTTFLRSIVGLQELRKNAKLAVNQASINQTDVKNCLLQLPKIEEQKEIVRLVYQYFAFADTIEAQVKKAQARVNNLTQSILAKAFRGELVPQDPNDEPADKLLERIAEARKEAEAAKKRAAKKST